jgi:hypothetical protein
MPQVTEYILSAVFADAIATVEIDWKWKRVASDIFETPNKTRARVVTRTEQLRGLPMGTTIYKAHNWWNLSESELARIRFMIKTGHLVERYHA